MNKPKLISFYLPQYHPIPENNEWWGQGFTEWTNVVQAKPRFSGHYQPHVPSDLGFYDLRLNETKMAQIKLAQLYGISGFCYYHYWFNGRMLLEKPFNDVLSNNNLDLPFCLCWANENWTRAWDGLAREILIEQQYSDEDNYKHIQWFINAFKDKRYIKVDGKPLLLIYRLDHIPNVEKMVSSWRDSVKRAGFPDLYICAVKNGFVEIEDAKIISLGFDAIVDFQPNRNDFPRAEGLKQRIYQLAKSFLPDVLYQKIKLSVTANNIVNYANLVQIFLDKNWPSSYRKYPCVFPSWDNSARRKSATIIQNDDPAKYGAWIKKAISYVKSYPESESFVFINAWNEWAEGCHLEPDLKNGRSFLEETRDALSESI
jgi:lipopolysaccharide biosynthesis protein